MKIASCDIETSCGVPDCPNYGGGHADDDKEGKCNHAVHHKINKIDIIGVYDGAEYINFGNDVEAFNEWYSDNSPRLVYHRGKFDRKTLQAKGANIRASDPHDDTMLMGVAVLNKVSEQWLKTYNEKRVLLNEQLPKGQKHRLGTPRSLKTMAPYYLGVKPFWENPETHDDEEYNKMDCVHTYNLAVDLRARMVRDGTTEFYEKYLLPWDTLITEAEYEGVLVDEELMHQMYSEAQKDLRKMEREISSKLSQCYEDYVNKVAKPKLKGKYKSDKGYDNNVAKLPETFNLASPQQMLYVLQWAGIDTLVDKRNKETNEWVEKEGTDKFVLKRAKVKNKNEFAAILLQYREKETEVSYLKQYINACVGGRIYASFNLDGTRTGRLSSSKPNLQNVKGALRIPFIIAESEKYSIYTVDSSQVEPRMIAYLTADEQLVRLFQQGRDYHNYATQLMFPETRNVRENDVKEKFKDLRNNVAKHADLSSLYGTGAFTLCTMCLVRGERDVSQEQAQKWLDEFRGGMKTVMGWKRMLEDDYKRGVKIFDPFGFPVTANSNSSVHMTLFNTYVQGMASRSIFHASLLAYRKLWKMDARPLMWVHDEVVWRLPKGKEEECKKIIDEMMCVYKLETPFGRVPLACEGKISDRWEK